MDMNRTLERILPKVQKPARYTGGEYNAVVKDKDLVDTRYALCFPDTYEIGMSNLGCRILYGLMNEEKDIWTLKKYFIRDYNDDLTDRIRSGRQIDTTLALSSKDFYLTEKTVETLNYHELNHLIDTQRMRGDANVKFALIEKNTRFALPFSAFILTIMGVALSSKKRRGGIGWNIGIGIALAFTYILFLRFSQMFVHTDTLPPAIALWLPNVVFAVIAGFLYRIAPK